MPYREKQLGFFVHLEMILRVLKILRFGVEEIRGAIFKIHHSEEDRSKRVLLLAELEKTEEPWKPPALHPNWHRISMFKRANEQIDKCVLYLYLVAETGRRCGITEEMWQLAASRVFQDG